MAPISPVVTGLQSTVALSREGTNSVSATASTAKVAVELIDHSKMESANKLLAHAKYATGVGAVANGVAAGVNAYNVYTAVKQGDLVKAATTSVVTAGNVADATRGVMTFFAKQVNPAWKAAGVVGDAASFVNTVQNPNSTWTHKISAGVAVAAGALSLAGTVGMTVPVVGTVLGATVATAAGAVEGIANVVSANETRKELAAAEAAAANPG